MIQPLVSEYSHVQVLKQVRPQFECSLDNKRCIVKCLQCGPTFVHRCAKLLRRTLINGGSGMTTDNNDINVTDRSVEAAMNPSFGEQLQNDSSGDYASSAECSNCGNKVMVEADHSSKESVGLAFGVLEALRIFQNCVAKFATPKTSSLEYRKKFNMR